MTRLDAAGAPDTATTPSEGASALARVFVSYAREDLAFVREMSELLELAGRDVWVDLDQIPSSAEWQREIDAGIDSADVVIVVLSPDWVASQPCHAELARALDGGKRLVPMVRRAVDPALVPPELASLQWLACEGAAPADVLGLLTETLDTDLTWVKAHTRLLVRALEWESNAEDRSLLLRGKDLSAAEAALAAHADDQPEPTALQRRYAVTSRQAATRSGRLRFGAVTVALVVSLGLTVVAFLERSNAQHQANIATVRALSADSVAEQGSDPEVSLLLAIEAVKRSDTDEAVRALRQALEGSQLVGTLHLPVPYHAAAFSPTGRALATAADDGVRILPDWLDPTQKTRFLDAGTTFDVEWSPDSSQVVTAGRDGTASIWDAASGKRELALRGHTSPVSSASFSADGSRVVTAGADGTARTWDATTGGLERVLLGHTAPVAGAAFSPDGTRVITASYDGTARIWDAATGAQLLMLRSPRSGPNPVAGAAFSPDGRHVVTTGQKVATIWDATDGHLVRELIGHQSGQIYSAAYGPDGSRIITAGGDSTARVWDAESGVLLSTLYGHTDQVERASFSPTGSIVVTSSIDGTVRVWRAEPGPNLTVFPSEAVRVTGAALSPDARQVVTARWDGSAVLWTLGADPSRGRIELRGDTLPVFWVTFSPDGRTVATSSIDGTVRLWDTRTGAQALQLASQPEGFYQGTTAAVDFSPDGRYLAGAAGSTAYVWDLRNAGELAATWQPSTAPNYVIHKIVFAPDGRSVLTADNQGDAVVYDWRTHAARRTIHADAGELYSATFSRDGRRIVTSGADGTAKLWDARTGRSGAVLRGHVGIVFDAEFSPDSTHVVTAGSDATARLWDARRGGQALVVFHGHTDLLASAAFSKDGTQILTSSADGSARLFSCDLCQSVPRLVRLAQMQVTRQLTPAERRRFGL